MSKQTYRGSCHCQAVKYELDADLSKGTGKCNCSFCAKVRNWTVRVKPPDLRITGEDSLTDYRFRADSVNRHRFCKVCGVRICTAGHVAELGGDFVSVSVPTVDGLSEAELAALPVRCMDGRADNWFQEPAVRSHM